MKSVTSLGLSLLITVLFLLGSNVKAVETVLLSETFETSQGGFSIIQYGSRLPDGLSAIWKYDVTNKQMKASAFVNSIKYEAQSWLVSPELDFTDVTSATLTFDHAAKDFAEVTDELTVWVGTQEPYSSAFPDWHQLTVPVYPSDGNQEFVSSGKIDLSFVIGKKHVFIYFKYKSTKEAAPTWKIKNVKVVGDKKTDLPTGTVEPLFVDFGNVEVGSSATREIRITPLYETDDLIIDISPATSTFTLSPLSIIDKNKGTLSATITYTPTGTYTDEAKLTVVGAGFNPPIIVPLKGNGVVQSSNVILDESLLTEESFNKFYKENVIGDETWYFSNKYGAGMSGYNREEAESYANEDWLLSPSLNLGGITKAMLSFEHAIGPTSLEIEKGNYSLMFASDYDVPQLEEENRVPVASWEEVTIPTYPDNVKWVYSPVEIEIPAKYLTQNFGFAFRYKSTDKESAIWEIKNIKLTVGRAKSSSSIQSTKKANTSYVSGDIVVINATQTAIIEVYDVRGQDVMMRTAVKGFNYINGLQKGQIYIFKFANETYKIVF